MNNIVLHFNGEEHHCTPYNTSVWVFSKEFGHCDHVYLRREGSGEGAYIFGRPDIVRKLRDTGDYPVHYLPYVPDNDLDAYERYMAQKAGQDTITEDEIAKFHEEVERDGVIGHWEELE